MISIGFFNIFLANVSTLVGKVALNITVYLSGLILENIFFI